MKATLKDLHDAKVDTVGEIPDMSYISLDIAGVVCYLWPKDNRWHTTATDDDGHMAAYFSADKAFDYLMKLRAKLQQTEDLNKPFTLNTHSY